VVLAPDVGEALTAAGLLHTLLQRVELSPWVSFGRRGASSIAHSSRKCYLYEARSESAVPDHFSANACGVGFSITTMLPAVEA
jgi:hypothetical protein